MMAFEGCRDLGEVHGTRVIAARSWHGRRPTRKAAFEAVSRFLAEKMGEEDVPFSLREDGSDRDAPNKCGWAFWVLPEDTAAYLKENLEIERYGTAYEPGQCDVDEDEAPVP